MADIIDQADDAQEVFMREAMSRMGTPKVPKGIGMCLNCSAEIEGDGRWCDADCRLDWEREERRKQNRRIHLGV